MMYGRFRIRYKSVWDGEEATMSKRVSFELKEEFTIRKLYSFHYSELVKDYVYPGEKHDFWEFLYVDKGEVEVVTGQFTYTLKQGEIVFYAPNAFHSLRCNRNTPVNIFIVSFECQSEAMRFFTNKSLRVGDEERKLLSIIISEGQHVFRREPGKGLCKIEQPYFGSEQILKIYLEALFIQLIRREMDSRKEPKLSALTKEREDQSLAERIERYLQERVSERLTLRQISEDFAVSETYMRNVFREHAGCGLMEYLSRLRIEEAKLMIRKENYTVSEIAERLGYRSIHYFSRQFKQKTGMSPSEYLRSLKARM